MRKHRIITIDVSHGGDYALADYAAQKDVDVLVWYNAGCFVWASDDEREYRRLLGLPPLPDTPPEENPPNI